MIQHNEDVRPKHAWIVCLSAALFFFYIFIQMNFFNAIEPTLFKRFAIDSSQMANLSQMYFYGNVLSLFPAGMILDRFSTRRVLLVTTGLCVLCTWWFARSSSLIQAEVARFIIGSAGAFCLLAPVRLASRWFPAHKMGFVIGVVVTMAMIGGMVAQAPLTWLTDHLGSTQALYIDIILGVIVWFCIFANVNDVPPGHAEEEDQQHQHISEMGLLQSTSLVLRNRQNWLAGLYASIINLPVFWLGFWGVNYLIQAHNLARSSAAAVISMVFLGVIIGSPLYGRWSDAIQQRKLPIIIGAIASVVVMSIIIWLPGLSYANLLLLFFALGLVTSSQVIAYPIVAESNPLSLTGTAESVSSVLIMAGGFTLSLLTWLLGMHWSGKMLNHVPIYSQANYHFAFAALPILFFAALILALFIRETHGKAYQQDH